MGKLTAAEAILLRAYRLKAKDALIAISVDDFNIERGVLFGGFEKVSRFRTSAGVVVDFIEWVKRGLVLTNRAQRSDGGINRNVYRRY